MLTYVTEYHSLDDLGQLEDDWSRLAASTPQASFFQSLPWLQCYGRHFGGAQRWRVLTVHVGDTMVGILPLVVREERFRVGSLRVLTYPLHDWGSFYGPVGPDATVTLLEGLRYVLSGPRDWDLIDLRWIDASRVDAGRTQRVMRQLALTPIQRVWALTAQIDLAGGWDEYWRSRRRKWRENVRRDERAIARLGAVTYTRYRPGPSGDPRWDLFDACVEVARRSWQGSSNTGTTLSHTSVSPFLREMHAVASASGAADLNLLHVGKRPVAFAYNYYFLGHVAGLRMGFDADPALGGAGTVLSLRMIRDSFERGDRVIDLGPHYLNAKRNWLTAIVPSYRCIHYPRTVLRAQLLWLQHCLLPRQDARAKAARAE